MSGSVRSRGRALAMAAALALLLFIVLPGTIYLGNLPEFVTVPLPLARLLLVPAALFVFLALIALRAVPAAHLPLATSVLAMLVLLVWVQAYLLNWHYGVLDGSPIDWDSPAWRGWLDTALWLGGLGAAVTFHRRLERPLALAVALILLLQGGQLAAAAFAQRAPLGAKAARPVANDLAALVRFSPERNVLQLVLDSFQADVFHELVTEPGSERLRAVLDGFTFFEEHLGTFPATYLSMPVILGGRPYRNERPKAEYMDSVYAGTSVLNAAHAAGFEVDVASDAWVLEMLMKGQVDHAYRTSQDPLLREAARIVDLSLFRGLPHWLKPRIYNDQRWLTTRWATGSPLLIFPYFTHNALFAAMTRQLAVDRQRPTYKFIHVMSTHSPFVANPDCSFAGRTLPRDRANVTAQSRCTLVYVAALLEKMKAAGVYDDTLIVLMADHGGHVPPHRYTPGDVEQDGASYALPPDLLALATPLLAIKPAGAAGPLQISGAFTQMSDIAATIDQLAGLDGGLPGTSVFEATTDPTVSRTFFGQQWSKLDQTREYIQSIQENTVTGSAYDVRSWHVGTTYLPPED